MVEHRVTLSLMDLARPLQGQALAVASVRLGLGAEITLGGEVGLVLAGNLRGQPVPSDTRPPNGPTAIGQSLEATRTPLNSLTGKRIWTVERDLFAPITAG
jgi:hypothetical protein